MRPRRSRSWRTSSRKIDGCPIDLQAELSGLHRELQEVVQKAKNGFRVANGETRRDRASRYSGIVATTSIRAGPLLLREQGLRSTFLRDPFEHAMKRSEKQQPVSDGLFCRCRFGSWCGWPCCSGDWEAGVTKRSVGPQAHHPSQRTFPDKPLTSAILIVPGSRGCCLVT